MRYKPTQVAQDLLPGNGNHDNPIFNPINIPLFGITYLHTVPIPGYPYSGNPDLINPTQGQSQSGFNSETVFYTMKPHTSV